MEEHARDKFTNSLLNRVFLDAVAVNRDFNRMDKVILANRAEQQVIFKKAITKAIPCVRAYLFLNKQQKEKLLEKLSKVIVKLINSIELAIVYPYRNLAKLFAIKGLYNDKNLLIKKQFATDPQRECDFSVPDGRLKTTNNNRTTARM